MTWIAVGGRHFDLAFRLTPLTTTVAVLVVIVSAIVFVYATTYMRGDPRQGRFFRLLSLFIVAMLALVLAADVITLFIAWEIVGLCSYLLIGFWFEKKNVPEAASLAFITTRIGDAALLAGLLLLVLRSGSPDIDVISASAFPAAAFLLFIGAATKSAQIPFQSWLPEAMVGPTPVSALLHSATMVAAGVFLVARFYPLFVAAPNVLHLIAWIGAVSALFGSAMAMVATDLKRALAYSTISQLGLMYVGLGAGSLVAGIALLIAQALYKSTLFLAAGAVDDVVGSTELARMGGLRRSMPLTFTAFLLAAAALAGLPVTMALPAKDAVLSAAWNTSALLFLIVAIASFITAIYSARLVALVFFGEHKSRAREDRSLAFPAILLAALLIFGPWLFGTTPRGSLVVTVFAISIAVIGFAIGAAFPDRFRLPGWETEFGLRTATDAVGRLGLGIVGAAARVDATVMDPIPNRAAATLVRGIRSAAGLDRATFDRVATLASRAALQFIRAARSFDIRALDEFVRKLGDGTLRAGQAVRRLQTGRIENYLLMIYTWFALMMVWGLSCSLR